MTVKAIVRAICAGVIGFAALAGPCSDASADDRVLVGPVFNQDGELLLPSNYREWVNLTSSLNLSYDSEVNPDAPPPDPDAPPPPSIFQNVFASPYAYRVFRSSGTWPNGTMLLIEIRQAIKNETVREGALVQGELRTFVADVKDVQRYGGNGWRFFSFAGKDGSVADQAAPQDLSTNCYSCHAEHGAVDNTMVQFYPSLFEIAKDKGTVRPDWEPDAKL